MSTHKTVLQLIVLAVLGNSLPAFAQQTKMNDYSSPKAVYESMRDAIQARDWGRYLDCLTTAAQKMELFEAYFACAENRTEQSRQILKPLIDWNKVKEEYDVKKEARLRAIAAKGDRAALKEAEDNYSTIHNDLYSDAFFNHISDKVRFYAAARALLDGPLHSDLGEFDGVVITADTAKGTATMRMFHLESGKEVTDEERKDFQFRKVNGRWLIDAPLTAAVAPSGS